VGTEPVDYCREIETYLCRKNDGHLIRIAGPSFDLVGGWAAQGVPLKVAFRGIDRYFERYYSKGPRRRPVRIDFCDADVLDTFDEWRRATGLTAATEDQPSAGFDDLLDRVSQEMDVARGVRGAKRQALLERLAALDRELLDGARASLDDSSRESLAQEADEELAGFRASMSPDAFARAREAAIDRLVRERAGLPTIAFL
jgi:hypothetical protein